MTRRSQRAFTLIEMLVAVAVLAIALGAIISGMGLYTRNAADLRERTLALIVAHNRLTELELERAWPNAGKSDGDVELGGVKWEWTAEVKATPDPHLRRVDLSVTLPGRESASASLSAFLADSGRQ